MIQSIKLQVWEAAGKDSDRVNEARKGNMLDPETPEYWEAVLRALEPVKKKRKTAAAIKLSPEVKARYRAAKYAYELHKYPAWINDGHFLEPDYSIKGANDLTNFCLNYIKWIGGRATRVSSAGRMVDGKFIPSTTRKGTADISATLKGRAIMLEIKWGSDRPSPAQLKEQAKERAAGGVYEFISTPEELFSLIDNLEGKELF